MKKFLLYSSALVLLSGVAEAACIQTPTCSSLGYTSSSSCTGGTKCPFGNAWNCTVNEIKTELTNKITELEKIIETSQQEEVQSKLKVGDILYSDMTCSSSNLSGKTPIGVIFDTANGLALGLEKVNQSWSEESFDIPNLSNITNETSAQYDWNGQNNTKLIWNYCKDNGKSCPAFEYVTNYKTEGTSAGDWFLPSVGLWKEVYLNKDTIQISFNKMGKTFGDDTSSNRLWSSTELSSSSAWTFMFFEGHFNNENKNTKYGIIPAINFGKCTYTEDQPNCNVGDIFYSDKTCNANIVISKTPIGVVFDVTNRLIIGLTSVQKAWSENDFDVPELTIMSMEEAKTDWQGQNNTKLIFNYCKAHGKKCPAFEYVNTYKTEGTNAGDWYLPASGELLAISRNLNILNVALDKVGGTKLDTGSYWSSSEYNGENNVSAALVVNILSGTSYIALEHSTNGIVLPVMSY